MQDDGLLEYATPKQAEYLRAAWEHGSERKAALALGLHYSTINSAIRSVKKKAAARGYSPNHDMQHTVPDGFHVRGVSTLYSDGEVRAQWVKSTRSDEALEEIKEGILEGLKAEIPRLPKSTAKPPVNADLMTCYVIGDHHLGLYTWEREAGADHDLDKGAALLCGAINYLADAAPPSEAALYVMGDFTHADSLEPLTPANKNVLDVDSRFAKVAEVAVSVLRRSIDKILSRHSALHIKVIPGNHDPTTSIWLRVALALAYEREPRVVVDDSPRAYQYHHWGRNLVMLHHGHGAKPNDLPMILAADCPEEWGQSTHRFIWTAHIHNRQSADHPGVQWESFRVLPPGDAWHDGKGYRAKREMKAIILHKKHGEHSRLTVNPEMLT